jgi:hypothetical protein
VLELALVTARHDLVEQTAYELATVGLHCGDTLRRERLLDQTADTRVLGRVARSSARRALLSMVMSGAARSNPGNVSKTEVNGGLNVATMSSPNHPAACSKMTGRCLENSRID